jgi:hypothetical protein
LADPSARYKSAHRKTGTPYFFYNKFHLCSLRVGVRGGV